MAYVTPVGFSEPGPYCPTQQHLRPTLRTAGIPAAEGSAIVTTTLKRGMRPDAAKEGMRPDAVAKLGMRPDAVAKLGMRPDAVAKAGMRPDAGVLVTA
jgi:hypothetical protein